MRILGALALSALLFPAAAGAGEEPPPVRVERVKEILEAARPLLTGATGLEWPEGLKVERTDPAGLHELLLEEFAAEVAALHPERPASSRRLLADALARAFSRVVRAKYGLRSRRIHVAPGALDRLPEGVSPDDALVVIAVHEAVHAMDDAAVPLAPKIESAAADPERLRALRMVIEGRAEYFGAVVAGRLGVAPEVAARLVANRDPGERLTREAGRAFVAALEAKEKGRSAKALRDPPLTTSVVFHPARFGAEPGEDDLDERLARVLPAAEPGDLSELLLRKRFLSRMGSESVRRAFSGFVRGRTVSSADGSRAGLIHCEDEASATRLYEGLAEFEGVAAKPGGTTKELTAPDGRRFSWAATRVGELVGEILLPPGPPPLLSLAKAMFLQKN